jgi:hypothetical protein
MIGKKSLQVHIASVAKIVKVSVQGQDVSKAVSLGAKTSLCEDLNLGGTDSTIEVLSRQLLRHSWRSTGLGFVAFARHRFS